MTSITSVRPAASSRKVDSFEDDPGRRAPREGAVRHERPGALSRVRRVGTATRAFAGGCFLSTTDRGRVLVKAVLSGVGDGVEPGLEGTGDETVER